MLHLSLVSPAPFCYLVAEHGIERMLFLFYRLFIYLLSDGTFAV